MHGMNQMPRISQMYTEEIIHRLKVPEGFAFKGPDSDKSKW